MRPVSGLSCLGWCELSWGRMRVIVVMGSLGVGSGGDGSGCEGDGVIVIVNGSGSIGE